MMAEYVKIIKKYFKLFIFIDFYCDLNSINFILSLPIMIA